MDSETSEPTENSSILDQLLDRGFASVRLSPTAAALLAKLYDEATNFFALEPDAKERYGIPSRVSGYRPFSYANTGSPDRPDLNDSFLYWQHRRNSLPHEDEISEFLDANEAYRAAAAEIVERLFGELSAHYDYGHKLPFENASVLQVNSFRQKTDAELYQYLHEDAVLLTVIWASHPGLEGLLGDEIRPFTFARDEVLVMPGSVLTMMTGGQIEPFFHQARNLGHEERKSIMYFVCPDADGPIEPFIRTERNEGVDIQRLVIENPQSYFGLAQDFVSA